MSWFVLLSILFCNFCFSSDAPTRSQNEPFFDYVCRIKQLELSAEERLQCRRYLQDPSTPLTPCLETLQALFAEQLKRRVGSAVLPRDLLDTKVSHLMRGFLKDKLALHKPLLPRHDLAERAQWDPHFHGSSLFADYLPKAKLYLPNYQEAYDFLKEEHRKLPDRLIYIKQAMESLSFATITEAGSGYDKWHITHGGKKIVPILAHARQLGPVLRHDVLGYDLCGVEEEDCYRSQKAFFESLQGDPIVRVHVGETLIPSRGRENVHQFLNEAEKYYRSSKPLRIGHGTHIGIEDMKRVAAKGYYIEACLSSNKRTGIINHRSDYPLGVMLLLGVQVVIGTDGGRLYSTSLAEEYAHAARNLETFRHKLSASDEPVVLPNGEALCCRHIFPLMQGASDEPLTYRQLGAILDPATLAKISEETLIANANRLLKACYPHL